MTVLINMALVFHLVYNYSQISFLLFFSTIFIGTFLCYYCRDCDACGSWLLWLYVGTTATSSGYDCFFAECENSPLLCFLTFRHLISLVEDKILNLSLLITLMEVLNLFHLGFCVVSGRKF